MPVRMRQTTTATETMLQELFGILGRIAVASPTHLAALLVLAKGILRMLD